MHTPYMLLTCLFSHFSSLTGEQWRTQSILDDGASNKLFNDYTSRLTNDRHYLLGLDQGLID